MPLQFRGRHSLQVVAGADRTYTLSGNGSSCKYKEYGSVLSAGLSASTVSRICARFDEHVRTFLSRPFLDAVPYVSVRDPKGGAQSFGGASWQVCTVDLQRSAAEQMRKTDAHSLRPAFSHAMHTGSVGYDGLIEQFRILGYYAAASLLHAYRADALTYRTFPREHWKTIYTTNLHENINSVLKRRLRSAGPFPADASAMRLADALLMRLESTVFAGKTYLYGMDEVLPDEEEEGETTAGADVDCCRTFDLYPVSGNRMWQEVFS